MKLAKIGYVAMFVMGMAVLTTGKVWAAVDPFAGCQGPTSSSASINTALGCVPVDPAGFIGWLLPWLLGVGGGISFLLMVYGFILITTSAGDPKAVAGAQETITSAIMGLLLSTFALFLLRLIVLKILVIPGIN